MTQATASRSKGTLPNASVDFRSWPASGGASVLFGGGGATNLSTPPAAVYRKHIVTTPTAASVCALTRHYVTTSAAFAELSPGKARQATRLVDRACAALTKGGADSVQRFNRIVRSLRKRGLLTPAQASTLIDQAATLAGAPMPGDDEASED